MGIVGTRAGRDGGKDWNFYPLDHSGPCVGSHTRRGIRRRIRRREDRVRLVPRPGALGLPHHTNALLSLLALGVAPPHLSQGTDAEVDVLRGTDAVIRQEQPSKEDAIADLEGIVLEEGSAELVFDDRANRANQIVALGLGEGVQTLNSPAVVVTGSFE